MPKLFVATKAFIENDGKILILRESSEYEEGTNASKYDVPGGRLVPGENFLEALAREIQEETGLKVTIGKPFSANEWRPSPRGEEWQVVGTYFHCHSSSSNVELSQDHDDFQWIEPEEYKNYNIIDSVEKAFIDFLDEAKKN